MSDPTTLFRLALPGLTVEVSGEQTFVEEMFGKVSQDLTELLSQPASAQAGGGDRGARHVWVYVRGSLFNKVYLSNIRDLERGPLGRFLDPDRVRRVYTEGEKCARYAGFPEREKTLWAEFTEEGQAMLRRGMSPLDNP
jgi:hypothetical protein